MCFQSSPCSLALFDSPYFAVPARRVIPAIPAPPFAPGANSGARFPLLRIDQTSVAANKAEGRNDHVVPIPKPAKTTEIKVTRRTAATPSLQGGDAAHRGKSRKRAKDIVRSYTLKDRQGNISGGFIVAAGAILRQFPRRHARA